MNIHPDIIPKLAALRTYQRIGKYLKQRHGCTRGEIKQIIRMIKQHGYTMS